MPQQKRPIELPKDLVRAYKNAPPEKRQRAERAMAVALMSPEDAAEVFRTLTKRTSEYARKQGLTPEKLDKLLREENEE